MGALLGDEVRGSGPWRPGLQAARPVAHLLERWRRTRARSSRSSRRLSFEKFFAELVDIGGAAEADPEVMRELCARYGLEMGPERVPGLVDRFGLQVPRGTPYEPGPRSGPAGSRCRGAPATGQKMSPGLKRKVILVLQRSRPRDKVPLRPSSRGWILDSATVPEHRGGAR